LSEIFLPWFSALFNDDDEQGHGNRTKPPENSGGFEDYGRSKK